MAVDLSELIDFELLKRYDSKIKAWHAENSNSKRYVVFAARENFPTTGDSEVLYIDNDKKMYCWNETTSQYELLSSGNADEEGDKNFSWSNW